MAPAHDLEFPDDDPIREYTAEEKQRLTTNLAALLLAIHSGGFRRYPLDRALLIEFHRDLFGGVREHAGRMRSKDFGSDHLIFGPNRSAHKAQVQDEIDRLFGETRKTLPQFESSPNDPHYEERAIHLAIWLHAEIIRVHPFEDGNGRTSRLILDQVLVVLGLRPIPIEACKDEYTAALNHYFSRRDIQPLIDVFLSVPE